MAVARVEPTAIHPPFTLTSRRIDRFAARFPSLSPGIGRRLIERGLYPFPDDSRDIYLAV